MGFDIQWLLSILASVKQYILDPMHFAFLFAFLGAIYIAGIIIRTLRAIFFPWLTGSLRPPRSNVWGRSFSQGGGTQDTPTVPRPTGFSAPMDPHDGHPPAQW